MADYRHIIPFIKKAEGGLSKAKTDTASKYPVPDGSGYHTNKGITYKTFESMGNALGYQPTANLFYEMPDPLWEKIFKKGYWDVIKGDQIKSQAIADTMVDFAWGAGPGTAVKKMQQTLGIKQDGVVGPDTLTKINKADEKMLLDKYSDAKKKYYLTLPGQAANYKGWESRLNKLYEFASSTIKKHPLTTFLALAGIFGIFYLLFNSKSAEPPKI